MNILLAQVYGLLGTLAVTCYGLPWFSLLLLPLAVLYYYIQRFYRRTSRYGVVERWHHLLTGVHQVLALRS